jgi:hypothetical protein
VLGVVVGGLVAASPSPKSSEACAISPTRSSTVRSDGRHIPAELRTAMIVSGRECSIDGCHGREYLGLDDCEIDYAKKGPTARWNLAWLCSIHHKRKTIGWTLGPPDPATGKRRLDPPRSGAPPRAA